MKKPHSSTQIDALGDRKVLLHDMVELAASHLGPEFCDAISLNPLKGTFHKSLVSTSPPPKSSAHKQLPPWMAAIAREAIETKSLQFEKIPPQDDQSLPQDSPLRTLKYIAALPLFTKRERKTIAILFLGYASKKGFTDGDHSILTYISEKFEPLLEGAWLLGRYKKVIAAGQKINQELQGPEAIVKQLYKEISGVLDTSYYISLSVYNPQYHTFEHHRYYKGEYTRQPDAKFIGGSAHVIKTGKHFITSDYSEDLRLYGDDFPKIVQAYDEATPLAESMAFIPLFYQKEPLGVLSIQHDKPRAFDEEDVRIIKLLGNQVALALNYLRLLYYMEKINESGNRLIQPLSARTNLLKEVTDHILDVTKASIVVLYPYHSAPGRATQDCFLKGVESGELLRTNHVKQNVRVDDVANLALNRALDTGRAELFVTNSKTLYEKLGGDPNRRKGDFEDREGILSTAMLVLRAGEEAVGVLFVNYRTPQTFDPLQRLLITTLAYFAAIAIKNHQALQVLRSEDFSVLRQIDQKMGQTFDIQEIMKTILRLAVKRVSADDAAVYLYDKRTNSLKAAATKGAHERLYRDSVIDLSKRDRNKPKGLVASAFFKGKPVMSNDVRKSRVYNKVVPGTRSELDVPFIDPVTRESVGVVNLESISTSAFNQAHCDFMVVLAGQAVVAIRNAQIYARVNSLHSSVEALRLLSKKVVSTQEKQKDTFEAILETARKLFNVEIAVLQLYDTGGLPGDSYIVKDVTPEVYKKVERIFPYKNKLGIIKYVAKTGKHFLTNDTQKEKRYKGAKVIRSELAVPLIFDEELVGVLDLESVYPSVFTEDDVSLLELFAAQAVLVVQSARRLLEADSAAELERHRLELLNEAATELNRINEPEHLDEAYDIVVSKVEKFSRGEIIIRRYVPEKREFHLVRIVNQYEPTPPVIPEEGSWNGRAKEGRLPIADHNLDDLPPGIPRPIAGSLVKSIIIAPVEFADSYYGNLIISDQKPNVFQPSDVNLLKVLATQLAVTLKRLEIIKAVRDTEKSNREMSVLSSVGKVAISLSHDLGTALAPVRLSAATLLNLVRQHMPKNKPRRAELIALAEAEAHRINQRMMNASNFAQDMKITFNSALQYRAEPEVISVNMLLEEIDLKYKGERRNKVIVNAPPSLGAVEVSLALVKLVFDYLISNAKEAIKGRGTITISASQTPRDVIISITDTGPGIKSSLLETIFEFGYTTKKQGRRKGTGFGLWHAREIIGSYKGTLIAHSRLGSGATFVISLPLTDKRSAFKP
ncbi:MAG: two-component system, OmpR family, sensor histidine kinase KdpD [Acidobacteriota bacterium]|jgi:GAF domain-containing protein|nr:two-component system, OmpR family, sensor histidine kinase KdpD [Acidobacteriota bacterium]